SVFTESKALGFKTALAGWYLPYCRTLGEQLDFCSSDVYERVVPAIGTSVWNRVALQLDTVDPFHGREQHISRHRHILDTAETLATNPDYGMVFVHWPVPHYPPVYDGRTHQYTLTQYSFVAGYRQNVVLVDDTLAAIRNAMEKAQVWD